MRAHILLVAFSIIAFSACSQDHFPDVVIETSFGNMIIRLYDDTPLHGNNFVKLVKEGYYDSQLFHRVIKNFMIQAGDASSINAKPGVILGSGGKSYTIPPEFNPKYFHKKGAVAAARQGDNVNPEKRSSGSQFYIIQGRVFSEAELNQWANQGAHSAFTDEQISEYTTLGGAPHLDGSYTIFGELIEGYDVLDIIATQPTDKFSRPIEDIKIIKVYTKERE